VDEFGLPCIWQVSRWSAEANNPDRYPHLLHKRTMIRRHTVISGDQYAVFSPLNKTLKQFGIFQSASKCVDNMHRVAATVTQLCRPPLVEVLINNNQPRQVPT